MAKCTATTELLAHGLLVQALLMPGFVLKRSCGGFVEVCAAGNARQEDACTACWSGRDVAGGAGCSSL
jgi:hypothetical protein